MLSKLTIKNVALIEYAEIEFGEGLNVLSGETGAGKSVILDSVNFVLGAKADRAMIRHGESECFVKAEFSLPKNSKAVAELSELDIETDGDIIISRKFSENGKTAIKINGNTVTTAMLRKVTDTLVDVHGQSEHFFLLKEANQLKMLDEVCGINVQEVKIALSEKLKEKRSIQQQISMLGGDEQERSRRLDILKYQIEEINEANLKEGEEEELKTKRTKIMHLEKIISAMQEATEVFSGENGVMDGLRYANRSIASISRFSEEYVELSNKIETLMMDVEDLSATISDAASDLYFDENEAVELEHRLDVIQTLKRKYGVTITEIKNYLEKIKAEYELLSDCEGQYAVLSANLEKLNKKIYADCQKITQLRKEIGQGFCERVIAELKTLNIVNAQFDIRFNEYTFADVENAGPNGLDEICFMFSANAGEPMKPLGKIISGGEMSRFMLAVKTQLSAINEIGTYIFDEIDAGISGKTAKVVGEKLACIAQNTQIIAVSHLAQIAALSDNEYLIEKQELDEKTVTHVHALNKQEKVKELIRLLGGEDGAEFAEKHAQELIKQADSYKKELKNKK